MLKGRAYLSYHTQFMSCRVLNKSSLHARQALYQLSYAPSLKVLNLVFLCFLKLFSAVSTFVSVPIKTNVFPFEKKTPSPDEHTELSFLISHRIAICLITHSHTLFLHISFPMPLLICDYFFRVVACCHLYY